MGKDITCRGEKGWEDSEAGGDVSQSLDGEMGAIVERIDWH